MRLIYGTPQNKRIMIFSAPIPFPLPAVSEMELHPCKVLISPTHTDFRAKGPNRSKILGINLRCSPLIRSSNKSDYQDFQEYAKPSRLLPAGGVRLWRDASSLEKAFRSSKSQALYKVRLQTSNSYGSGLSDVNSGILLCLIDENGSSILQRLSATSVEADDAWSETLRFERGAVDEFAIEGPHLGRIVALWISLESGQWRISGINLRVIPPLDENDEEMEQPKPSGLQYNFKLDDILLGEKGEASMMELRPNSVTAFSGDEESILFDGNLSRPASLSNEESLKEYTYLKLSLLLYDTVLILAGSAVASVSIGGNAAYAFLIGGLLGFVYLLVVQRSVDELPTPDVIGSSNEEGGGRTFGGLKGSVLIAALAFAFVVVMVRYAGEDGIKFEANDIIFGMMGFLMCKVAVVLAAFKPITPTFGDNE